MALHWVGLLVYAEEVTSNLLGENINNTMEQSPSWETDCHLSGQEILSL
jgi:hypothetical protein